jgi:hypothetical protein
MSASDVRVWINPNAAQDKPSLIRLTRDILTLAVVAAANLDDEERRVRNGGVISGQVIPLSSLTNLQGKQDGAELAITFRQDDSEQASAEVALRDRYARDELFDALERQLGTGWERDEGQESRFKPVFGLLVGMGAIALVTWLAYDEALDVQAGKPLRGPGGKGRLFRQVLRWLGELVGPTGVLAIGGVLAAVLFAVMLYGLVAPARLIILRPRERL